MNREEYLKERELNALERIAESLETIASHICKDEKKEAEQDSKYPGMEVSYL